MISIDSNNRIAFIKFLKNVYIFRKRFWKKPRKLDFLSFLGIYISAAAAAALAAAAAAAAIAYIWEFFYIRYLG